MHPSLTAVAGGVALVAGLHQAATGLRGVAGAGAAAALDPRARASLDSELRFYGTWYAAAGALALRHPEPLRRALGPVWLGCAATRLLSLRTAGRPHPVLLLLAAAEAAVGTALVVEERRADR